MLARSLKYFPTRQLPLQTFMAGLQHWWQLQILYVSVHFFSDQPLGKSSRLHGNGSAGQALHGDVLLAMPRMRPSEWGSPVVPWSSFPIDTFWRWLASLLPAGQYQDARGAPRLAQLPASFRWVPRQPTVGMHGSPCACLHPFSLLPPPPAGVPKLRTSCDDSAKSVE